MKITTRIALLFLALSAIASAQSYPVCSTAIISPTMARNTLVKCSTQLPQIVGGLQWRNVGFYLPTNWDPTTGLITKVNGTTHGLVRDCPHAPALNELAGWLEWMDTVPNGTAILCIEGINDTTADGTDPGERFNTWGHHNWTWVNGIVPDDVGLLAWAISFGQSALGLNPKLSGITTDWGNQTVLASEFAALHPELISAVMLWNDRTFVNVTSGFVDTDGTIIQPPLGPVSVIEFDSILSNADATMCQSTTRFYTADDLFNFWSQVDQPTTFTYGPATPTNFCTGKTKTALEFKAGSGGINGTEIRFYWAKGNSTGVPLCSFDYNGVDNPNVCGKSQASSYPHDFRVPPANCSWQITIIGTLGDPSSTSSGGPCNHYVTAPGYDLLGAFYDFYIHHPKP